MAQRSHKTQSGVLSGGDAQFKIVCLCGSAGALAGYQSILESLPRHTGMAFVIIAHRGDENQEMLPMLLARVSDMEAIAISDGTILEPDRIFVAPPHRRTTLRNLVFRVADRKEPRGWPVIISVFLKSMARARGSQFAAVILSGMGRDGSSALGAVKAAGGTTFAQSDALFSSMPEEACATGFVDFFLPAFEIGEALTGQP